MSNEAARLAPAAAAGVGRNYCLFYLFILFASFGAYLSGEAFKVYTDPWESIEDTIEYFEWDIAAKEKTTVAYAVTITKFRSGKHLPSTTLYDRAAVLHQSLKLAMEKSDRYDYHLYAFVHPDAIEVQPMMEKLGYRVQIRDTPFNISAVDNFDLVDAQRIGCCGEKEYLKLYSYLLFDYPVVMHVDMDYLILKPMEDIFDLMIDSSYNRSKFQYASMWTDMSTHDERVDFLFTRDYNMVNPGRLKVHQIGVQGGFLAVRPSQEDFDKLVGVIMSGGDFDKGSGWGGNSLHFGGYYGAGTIQGLASYYYGHLEPNRHIELNRCYYNTMVDTPRVVLKDNSTRCRTMEEECQDCTETPLEDIYSVHFTVCGKPEWCHLEHKVPLCRDLLIEWHKVRTSLEQEWTEQYPGYVPDLYVIGNKTNDRDEMRRKLGGHCGKGKKTYYPMVFPDLNDERDMLI